MGRRPNGDLVHWYWSAVIDPPRHDDWGALGVVAGDPVGLSTGDQHHVFYRTSNGTLEHRVFLDREARLVTDNWGGS
jgi:hypothetical protein